MNSSTLSLDESITDFINMNEAGQVLALCKKHYAKDVVMLNDGEVFASSMQESFDKQKVFVDEIKESSVKLVSKEIEGNVSKLIFHYKMKNNKDQAFEFTGEHIQHWKNGKIIKEEYQTVK